MVKQLDKNAYVKSVDQINNAIIDKVYRWQRPLAGTPAQWGVISHSGLLVQDMNGNFYLV